jgi:hypothetical protein
VNFVLVFTFTFSERRRYMERMRTYIKSDLLSADIWSEVKIYQDLI